MLVPVPFSAVDFVGIVDDGDEGQLWWCGDGACKRERDGDRRGRKEMRIEEDAGDGGSGFSGLLVLGTEMRMREKISEGGFKGSREAHP